MFITEDIIIRYIRGQASLEETLAVVYEAQNNPELEERLLIAERVKRMREAEEREDLPLDRLAAHSEDNLCAIQCEHYILRQLLPDYEKQTLLTPLKEKLAFQEGLVSSRKMEWERDTVHKLPAKDLKWLTKEGTALYNIGYVMTDNGLSITRQFLCSLEDLKDALSRSEGVIAVVNEDVLVGKEEADEPNHAVCVLAIGEDKISLYNPSVDRKEQYPLADFTRAWETSRRYAVFANIKGMKRYNPHPGSLVDSIELDYKLEELGEAIAEYAHDIWAEDRIKEGFVYGPETNTDLSKGPKTNKDLLPYSELPEKEKDYDRKMSMGTIRLLKKLGYTLERESDNKYCCPECGKKIRMEWKYCSNCGRPLEISDFKINRQRNAQAKDA